jgi:tRNA(Ile2) C34 agmatinyltransferase TiaS
MGRNQGFRCEKCGNKYTDIKKTEKAMLRSVELGLYASSTRSQRHLTKPLRRLGQEKVDASACHFIDGWHS